MEVKIERGFLMKKWTELYFLGCFYYKAAQIIEDYPDHIEFTGKHAKDIENFINGCMGLFLSANQYILSCQLLLTSYYLYYNNDINDIFKDNERKKHDINLIFSRVMNSEERSLLEASYKEQTGYKLDLPDNRFYNKIRMNPFIDNDKDMANKIYSTSFICYCISDTMSNFKLE